MDCSQNLIFNEKKGGISADWLKVIAMITMVIDHTGAVLFPGDALWRVVGRIAFPIYVWLLIMGFIHTSNVRKYILRMAIFSLISEIPFDLALTGSLYTFRWQNVFWTLTLSLIMLYFLEKILENKEEKQQRYVILQVGILIFSAMAIAEWLHFDYGCTGPALAAVFYFYAKYQKPSLLAGFFLFCLSYVLDPLFNGYAQNVSVAVHTVYASVNSELCGIIAVPLIGRYNGVRNWKRGKYLFYLFYPVHLMILYGISLL